MEVRHQLILAGKEALHTNNNIDIMGLSQIWTLPKLTLIFSTNAVSTLESVLTDSEDGPASSLPQDPPRKVQDLDIEQILIAPLGESRPRPHLLVSRKTKSWNTELCLTS